MSRPSLSAPDQAPLLGTSQEVVRVNEFINGCWHGCEACIEQSVEAVVSSPGTFLALRRACGLQETGKLKWAHGTAEGDAELAKLKAVDTGTLRKLAMAGGRMWVNRARMFEEIASIGKCDGEPRVLERPRTNRPGQRDRQR